MSRHAAVRMLTARLILAWFASTLMLAFAAPLVRNQLIPSYCSSQLQVSVDQAHNGHSDAYAHNVASHTSSNEPAESDEHAAHGIECALCIPFKEAAPTQFKALALLNSPLAYALKPWVSAEIEARVGAPFPARAPPAI